MATDLRALSQFSLRRLISQWPAQKREQFSKMTAKSGNHSLTLAAVPETIFLQQKGMK